MKTLQHYIDAGHVRYMPPEIQAELAGRVPRCKGGPAEALYWVLNGMTEYPSCVACSASLTTKQWRPHLKAEHRTSPEQKQGYVRFCGKSCAYTHGPKKETYRKTCQEKYGVDHPMKVSEVVMKIKATNIDKYGDSSPMRWTGAKFLDMMQRRHGTNVVRHIPGVDGKIATTKAAQTAVLLRDRVTSLEQQLDVVCITDLDTLHVSNIQDPVLEWRHSCGRSFSSAISYRGIRRCPSCSHGTSLGEQGVLNFIQDLGIKVVSRDRTVLRNRELDIWIPDKRIAIEFDGTYWHSADFQDRRSSLEKVERCDELGIQLITLQEHLWVNRTDQVKHRLASILGVTKKIGARTTQVVHIDALAAKIFLQAAHLQGSTRAGVYLGLEHKGELVAVATFGKPRWAKKYDWELIRMAFAPGVTVQGGASKLIKHFKQQYTGSLISYADRCWSTGNVYKQLGFKFSHHTSPSYWWVHHFLGTYARYQTQKKKLPKLLEGLNKQFYPELSEEDNMRMAGFLPLYDRGNSVWVLTS